MHVTIWFHDFTKLERNFVITNNAILNSFITMKLSGLLVEIILLCPKRPIFNLNRAGNARHCDIYLS